ncbi:MAG TPA: hypothetical protein VGJ41_12685 [Nocardioides sp.]|jgi:hypothetical protein
MSTFTNTMTVETRPAFALPVYDRTFGMSIWAAKGATKGSVAGATVQNSVFGFGAGVCPVQGIDASLGRDRHVTALAKGAFPGTSAWRPPNC